MCTIYVPSFFHLFDAHIILLRITAENGAVLNQFLKLLYGERVLTKKEKEKLEKLAKLKAKLEKEAIEAVC